MLQTYQLLALPINTGSYMAKLSMVQVCEKLQIARTTLGKWMLQGKIKFHSDDIGDRTIYAFDEKEVDRIRTSMTKRREKGKPFLKGKK